MEISKSNEQDFEFNLFLKSTKVDKLVGFYKTVK